MANRRRIGLLLDTLAYNYQNEILLGAHQELAAHEVDLVCFSGGRILTAGAPGRQESAIYDLIGPGTIDGLIVTTSTLANDISHAEVMAFCRRLPPVPLCSIGYQLDGIPSVLVDNSTGVRQLTTHLADVHGKSRIAFAAGPAQSRESQDRLAGYRAGLADRGLPWSEDLVIGGDFTHRAGVNAARQLFGAGGGCDAVIAANDWTALGVLEALDGLGVRVPRDVALIGFDDIDDARFTTPPLTTISQPIRRLGIEAARLVLAQIDGARVAPTMTLPTAVRIRQSCGCFDGITTEPPSSPPGRAGLSALEEDRPLLIETAAAAMPEVGRAAHAGWPERLTDALLADLRGGPGQRFLLTVDELLRTTTALGNIHAWHGIIGALRARCVAYLTCHPSDWLRLEMIFERAHVIISDIAERVQARRRLDQENMVRTLQQSAATLRTALDTASLANALAQSLPQINIASGYVVLKQADKLSADADAQLVVAYDRDRGSLLAAPRSFRGGDLVPADVAPQRRCSSVLVPLAFAGDLLGFSVLELGPPDGTVYEVLREQISSAVNCAHLFRTVVEEVTKREQAERARLEGEMRIATRIQTGILPKTTQVAGLEIAATMLPATEVGGDYFDVLPFDGGCWLGIGDVAGHGLPTGLVMLMIQSIVAATTNCRTDARPGYVWSAVNAVLYDNVRRRLEQDEHATLSLIRYESSGRFVFAGAHEELIIYRRARGRCETLPVSGIWAGVRPELPGAVPEESAVLNPGDMLILYTDGVTEAMDADHNQFGLERLCHEVEAVGDRLVSDVRDHLVAAVRDWSAVQFDDLTVVVLRQGDSVSVPASSATS
jgi:sigma-B regulation protein RsbU (phosphoserine phosphatase)